MLVRIAAMIALTLMSAGCGKAQNGGGPPGGGPTGTPGTGAEAAPIKGLYAMPACSGDTSNPLGTINIVLPDKIDGGSISRKVNGGPNIPKNDPKTGNGGGGGFNPNKPTATQPFDVFIDGDSYSGQSGYLMVRVLLTKPAKFAFWGQNGVNGVSSNDPNSTLMCGSGPQVQGNGPGNGQAEWISIFYLDVSVLSSMGDGQGIPFTIGLTTGNTGANPAMTPILIDPKIINDGGGMRIHL